MKCPKCNKDGIKKVYDEDGKKYHYECKSCGYKSGTIIKK